MALFLAMYPSWQTPVAFLVVGLAAAFLVRQALRKRRTPGCGGGECGAVSPDAKALRRRLEKS